MKEVIRKLPVFQSKNPKNQKILKQAGFTYIEVILAVAIMLIISASGTAFYSRFITQNSAANTSDQIVQSIRKAQTYAMLSRKSATSGWGVRFGGNVLTLYQGPSYTLRNSQLDENFTITGNFSVSGLGDLNFARVTGIPSHNGTALVTPITITISGQNNTRTITVNEKGMATK